MLELEAGAGSLGLEAHFELRRSFPVGRLPGHDETSRRLAGDHAPDLVLAPVDEALVEAPADACLEEDARPRASPGPARRRLPRDAARLAARGRVGEALLARPP